MSIQTIMLIMLGLGFVLGVLAQTLCRYAAQYADEIGRQRRAAMRAHPAGGRGELHVGSIHHPRRRDPRDEVFDQFAMPAQRAGDELPPGWALPWSDK